jgi:hypothetical protein
MAAIGMPAVGRAPMPGETVPAIALPGAFYPANLVAADGLPWANFVEYCRNGTLKRFLEISRPRNGPAQYLPEELLWRIFYDLIRGCYALTYAPRFQTPLPIPLPEAGPPLPEVPGRGVGRMRLNIVHFGIEPSNILCGDIPAAGPQIPIFKVRIGSYQISLDTYPIYVPRSAKMLTKHSL